MKRAKRRCNWCQSPLPRGSRATRLFCSTSCRVRDWHRRNRPPEPDARLVQLHSPQNPKHYHSGYLVGHRENVPWFGTSCPPECPGLLPGETFAPMEEFHRPAALAARREG